MTLVRCTCTGMMILYNVIVQDTAPAKRMAEQRRHTSVCTGTGTAVIACEPFLSIFQNLMIMALATRRNRLSQLDVQRLSSTSDASLKVDIFRRNSVTTTASEDGSDSLSINEGSVNEGCMKHRIQAASLEQTCTSRTAEMKKVRFNTVQVNSHAVILGNNPAVSSGLPVTIEWVAFQTEVFPVEEFERAKELLSRKRNEMILPSNLREDMIKSAGYSRSEMVAVLVELSKIRKSRATSAHQAVISRRWQQLYFFARSLRDNFKL